jgi:hypothetical protein
MDITSLTSQDIFTRNQNQLLSNASETISLPVSFMSTLN